MKLLNRIAGPLALLGALLPAMASNPLLKPDKTPIRPAVTHHDRRNPQRVFLEHADSLMVFETRPDVQKLTGNVAFRQGGMFMFCDSALFFNGPSVPNDSMVALGNVRLVQGDTLYIYGDVMDYSGTRQLVTMYGRENGDVRLINRTVTLSAPVLHYSLDLELGYYNEGGRLRDRMNTLTSIEGEYAPNGKEANFYGNVELTGVSASGQVVRIYTDTLLYNTDTRIAELPVFSRIVGKDGEIYSYSGSYNTRTNVATLLGRSSVRTARGNLLVGDRLIYNRATGQGEAYGNMVLVDNRRNITLTGDHGYYNEHAGFGEAYDDMVIIDWKKKVTLMGDRGYYNQQRGYCEAFGNMVLVDTVNKLTLTGDYGYYSQQNDSACATGHALAREYSQPDTFYLHGKQIRAFPERPDTLRLVVANPNVRFWRRDLQGVCDSMTFVERDTTVRMDFNPVVWSDNRQIFGGTIKVYLNDSTVRRADLPDFGFLAEHIEDEYYNQMSGRSMVALFEGGDLRQLDVDGSVQAIMLPAESDSTFNKIANIESSHLRAFFKARELEHAKLWSESSGTVTPLYLARRSLLYLPKFEWRDALRPRGPWDLIPVGEEAVATEPEVGKGGEDIGQ